jgi:hypothetical protein
MKIAKQKAKDDKIQKIRNFHKKYARIITPPDKNDANKNISSKTTLMSVAESKYVPKKEYIPIKKNAILESMNVCAKKKSNILTMNIITEFGKIKVDPMIETTRFGTYLCLLECDHFEITKLEFS